MAPAGASQAHHDGRKYDSTLERPRNFAFVTPKPTQVLARLPFHCIFQMPLVCASTPHTDAAIVTNPPPRAVPARTLTALFGQVMNICRIHVSIFDRKEQFETTTRRTSNVFRLLERLMLYRAHVKIPFGAVNFSFR